MSETVTPYKNDKSEKREQVAKMFNSIAPRYDFLNHFLSLGIDILWRKKAIKLLAPKNPNSVLDVATGTADFAVEALSMKPTKVVGLDISEGMLEVGRKKMINKKIDNIIKLELGDSENMRFDDNSFDAITCGFGVRNFQNLKKGLSEFYRVQSQGGQVAILEFSKPTSFPIKQLYNFYFTYILPTLGKLVSKDDSAYTYLPNSVKAFPDGDEFLAVLNSVGYTNTRAIPLTFGIASIYLGTK